MRLVLWGDRAVEFDADTVRSMGEKEPVIAIFVGTLPKTSHGNCYRSSLFTLTLYAIFLCFYVCLSLI
jgi:hypothetical protein